MLTIFSKQIINDRLLLVDKKIISVGTRFVADRNGVGFAREKVLTISFVERGFERLGLD